MAADAHAPVRGGHHRRRRNPVLTQESLLHSCTSSSRYLEKRHIFLIMERSLASGQSGRYTATTYMRIQGAISIQSVASEFISHCGFDHMHLAERRDRAFLCTRAHGYRAVGRFCHLLRDYPARNETLVGGLVVQKPKKKKT